MAILPSPAVRGDLGWDEGVVIGELWGRTRGASPCIGLAICVLGLMSVGDVSLGLQCVLVEDGLQASCRVAVSAWGVVRAVLASSPRLGFVLAISGDFGALRG